MCVDAGRGGVEVQTRLPADFIECAMRLNLESRLAQRVLWRRLPRLSTRRRHLRPGTHHPLDRLDHAPATPSAAVDVTSCNSPLRSLNFAALRIKDAVCDDLRERTGDRPDVDTRHPDLSLFPHVDDMVATLYVDTPPVKPLQAWMA